MDFTRADIQHYLNLLGREIEVRFEERRLPLPVKLLFFGGAAIINIRDIVPAPLPDGLKVRGTTEDIDYLPLNLESDTIRSAFRIATYVIGQRYGSRLAYNWINDMGAKYVKAYTPQPKVILWKTFGSGLEAYFPTLECLLALKILSGREKDYEDTLLLCHLLNIPLHTAETRSRLQSILNQFVPPKFHKRADSTLNDLCD